MNILAFGNGSLSVASQEVKLSIEWARNGHKVYLLCNANYRLFDVGDIPSHENLIIIDMPYNQYRYEYLQIDDKIDVCFGFDQSVCPFVADYKQRTKIKSFCMFLDFPSHVIDGKDPFNYNYGYSQRYFYWLQCSLEIDGIIFNNSVAVEEYYKRYRRQPHLVFYAISDDNYLNSVKEKIPSKDFIVGCHRLIYYKGTTYVLQALKKLNYNYEHLYVSGDPKEIETCKSLSREFKSNVLFKEKIGELEKMDRIWNAKLLVYPQITEWIGGLSILEGWSVNTPGICFDYPVLRELYQDCVLYAKPKSTLDLREKIDLLYKDEACNKEFAEKGYKRFKQEFTREIMANRLLKIFNG